MNNKNRISYLVQKLNAETISKREYNEFLSLVSDAENKKYFDEVLDKEIGHTYPEPKTHPTHIVTRRRWLIRMAAAATILLLILSGIFIFGPSGENNLTYTTSNGETLEVTLPDESIVKLNANSKLIWITGDKSTREVLLTGEAFFDVKHINGQPFRVYSNDVTIQVLGTSFNVNNRDGKEEIYLQEGKIQIQNQINKEDEVLLTTGESAYYDEESSEIIKITDQRFVDRSQWRNGILKYSDIPAKEILEQVEAIYGVKLILNDAELLERPMDFALPYSNWEVVSQGLALALGTKLVKHDDHYELIKLN